MLILAVTFFIFSLLLYHNFRQSLYENIDDLLRTRAEGVAASVDTYWETEKLDIAKDPGSVKVFSKINNINFGKIAQLWVNEKSHDPTLVNIIVQIVDINGRTIASSKNLPEFKNIFVVVTKGQSQYEDINIPLPDDKFMALRSFILPVKENDKVAYIVQVASPVTEITASLNRLKTLLFVLLPLMVFLTGIAGSFLARQTLGPVDSMIATIHQITAENLKQKIAIPRSNDEIQRLAETFNLMLQRLETYFATQQQFIQDLSHEFKTPLTILKGELEVTLKRLRAPAEYEQVLASSLEEINKLSRIIEDLLVLARFDNQEIRLEKKALDLGSLLRQTIGEIKILAEQKSVSIEYEAPGKITLQADAVQLKRVLLNLLDNAIKYTPAKGQIRIHQEAQGQRVLVKISDNGPGIPAAELAHIFDRFYRADKSRSKIGFGLGLSIAKSIIEAHQGTISAHSQEGQGTTFVIDLPQTTD